MEQIAWIIGHRYIYWSAVVRVLAVCAAVCMFLALYPKGGKKTVAAAVCIPAAIALSLLLSRMAHWYFRPDSYDSLISALDLRQPGGYALMGAFAGCFLTAGSLRLTRLTDDLPELLDCMCLAGGLGIALGRLASFFNSSDRGRMVNADFGLPWVAAVINPVSGETEYRLATFLLQSMACGLIFLALLVFYMREKRKKSLKNGDTALLFLLFYGAFQILLDSTRYDSLHFRSNGFVSVVQVLGAVAVVLTVIVFAVRLVRAGGWKKGYLLLWLVQAACLGLTGYMEYYVQRHGGEALFAYSVMGAALTAVPLAVLLTRHLGVKEERMHDAWLHRIHVREEGKRDSHT